MNTKIKKRFCVIYRLDYKVASLKIMETPVITAKSMNQNQRKTYT